MISCHYGWEGEGWWWWRGIALASLAFSARAKRTSTDFMCIFCNNPVEVLLAGKMLRLHA
jgi:hypothetical protein